MGTVSSTICGRKPKRDESPAVQRSKTTQLEVSNKWPMTMLLQPKSHMKRGSMPRSKQTPGTVKESSIINKEAQLSDKFRTEIHVSCCI